MNSICVVIVDDRPVVRKGLKHILEGETDIRVGGEAATVGEALGCVRRSVVDVILLSIRITQSAVVQAMTEIRAASPRTRVLVLAAAHDVDTMIHAFRAGTDGYLVEGAYAMAGLREAIRRVASDRFVGFVAAVPGLPALTVVNPSEAQPSNGNPPPLTGRECEVLDLIAGGKSNAEIAAALGLREKTVKNYINRLYTKRQIKSRYEAILLGLGRGSRF